MSSTGGTHVKIREGYKVCAPKGQEGLAQGFKPWVLATQKCALKVTRDEETRANDFDPIWRRILVPLQGTSP